MNELVDLIVKKKLPAPVGAQIDRLHRNDAAIQKGENLLEEAGVDTVPELKQPNAKVLYKTLVRQRNWSGRCQWPTRWQNG